MVRERRGATVIDFISAVFKGFYPYFAIPALAVICYRIHRRLWTRGETFLLVFVLAHALLQILQIVVGTHILYISRRYLLPCAPLLFGWCAWGIWTFSVWFRNRCGERGRAALIAVCSVLAVLLVADSLAPTLKRHLSGEKSREREIVETVAPVLREDYRGTRRSVPVRDSERYISGFRPVVVSDYPSLGYWSGGTHAEKGKRPYDYWLVEAGERPPANGREAFGFEISGRKYRVYVPDRKE